MQKILIVEDDILLAKAMHEILDMYSIFHAYDGQSALNMIKQNHFDLILLDLILPKMSGLEVIGHSDFATLPPIVAISAKADSDSELACYKLGIRNYIRKPVDAKKLKTLAESILTSKTLLTYKHVEIDLMKHQVFVNKIAVSLTPIEYQLLCLLYSKKGQAISREEILDRIWGIHCDVTTRVVDVNIQQLRKKLHLHKEIVTISKVGYRLENLDEY